MSSIYTRTGDRGETSLVDGSRTPKDALRVETYGTIDEANSWIGLARAHAADDTADQVLSVLQHRFFNCSSSVATPPGAPFERPTVTEEDIAFLERAIDRLEERSGPISCFVLPGGTKGAGELHVARTVARRAERLLVSLAREEEVDPLVVKLVNRSSDVLFALARYDNAVRGEGDVAWEKELELPVLK